VAPLANGTSLPATETVLKNLKRLGYQCDLDEEALAAVSAHYRQIAEKEGLPLGRPMEYDVYYLEHQVPGGMMTNLTRQLREIKMEDRLGEILEEVIRVRKDFGYPVMATPYSQIVGAQAFENVVSGERYRTVTDESIKYVLGYYGEPAVAVEPALKDRVMSLPRAKELLEWQPEGFLKSVQELREELGPELSDDDLLLKILIPGRPVRRAQQATPAAGQAASGAAPAGTVGSPAEVTVPAEGYPREFSVDVDGEVYTVRISPLGSAGSEAITAGKARGGATADKVEASAAPRERPEGAVLCGAPGLILSILVKAGDSVTEGDEIAMIESMKMKRSIVASRPGVVQETCAEEGQMVAADDVLLVVL
jgi:pyruvate carboxylase